MTFSPSPWLKLFGRRRQLPKRLKLSAARSSLRTIYVIQRRCQAVESVFVESVFSRIGFCAVFGGAL
jgi:hypothetical protein